MYNTHPPHQHSGG